MLNMLGLAGVISAYVIILAEEFARDAGVTVVVRAVVVTGFVCGTRARVKIDSDWRLGVLKLFLLFIAFLLFVLHSCCLMRRWVCALSDQPATR